MPDVPLTVNYPASLDTVVSGGEVANRAFTTLSNTITDTALSIPLTSGTLFPSTGVITLTDSLTAPTKTEDIIYTANSANTLTVPTGGRGAFGSTAQNWSGTVYVRMRMMAEHHEWARDAIIQLETIVGADATPLASRYATISHNHSGVYEPANANIQAHIASTSNPHSVTKNQVGLGSVENTALSTWAGSTNLTTLGTISAGTWNGAVIDEDYGGAGSINGILKANGSGTVSAAVSGTDYLSATAPGSSGQLLYNNAGAYAAASKILYGSSHVAMGSTAVINDRSLLYPLDASVNAVLSIQETFTSGLGATPTAQAITAHVLANPASSGMLINGLDVEVFSPSGNSQSMAGMVGHVSYVQHNGSGTVSIATGTQATVENAGSGTIPYAYGTFFSIANLSTGVITDAAAIAMYPPYDNGAGGHILNSYGMLIQAGGGDVRNQYGIYISDLSSFGSVSTFNLYSAGATAVNYFQGIVRALDVRNTTAAAGSVGSATLPFKYFYLAGDSGTPGTNNFKLTGTANAARTITFPDATDTVAVLGTAQTFSAAQSFSNTITQTSNSATAFQSGPNGGTNPVFRIVNSTASAATGISITGNAAGTAPGIAAISSGSNEGITYSVKGAAAHTFVWDTASSANNYWQITSVGSLAGSSNAGGIKFQFVIASGAARLHAASDVPIIFNSTSTMGSGTGDAALGRAAAGVIRVATASANAISGAGTFSVVAVTPAQITSDQNNYAPTVGWFQRWSSDASRNITGLVAGQNGQVVEIWNVGSNNIVLQNENASSTAANRFTTSTGADLTLTANKCALGRYDATTSRWRVRLGN